MARWGRLLTDAQWDKGLSLASEIGQAFQGCKSPKRQPQDAGRHPVDPTEWSSLGGFALGVALAVHPLAAAAKLGRTSSLLKTDLRELRGLPGQNHQDVPIQRIGMHKTHINRESPTTYLLIGVGGIKCCPQGLKPHVHGRLMSELRLRLPEEAFMRQLVVILQALRRGCPSRLPSLRASGQAGQAYVRTGRVNPSRPTLWVSQGK